MASGPLRYYTRPAFDRLARSVAKQVLLTGDIQPGEKILDVGCGTASCLITLALALNPKEPFIGVDASDGMLAYAKSQIARQNLSNQVIVMKSSAVDLPLPNESMDAVFSCTVCRHFDDREFEQAFKEVLRVLVPRGRLFLSEWGPFRFSFLNRLAKPLAVAKKFRSYEELKFLLLKVGFKKIAPYNYLKEWWPPLIPKIGLKAWKTNY